MSRSIDQWERDTDERPVINLFWGLILATVAVLVVVAIVGLATTGSIFFQGEAAKKTVGARTNTQVYSPENKIAQIAFFHNTCNTANAQLRIVKNNQDRLDADQKAAQSSTDPIQQAQAQNQLSSDQQDVTGALNVLQTTVADYNSRSAQSTANVFKGTNLPDRIVLPDRIDGNYTINCG